jgi:mono/diheme cytochrome c family protein
VRGRIPAAALAFAWALTTGCAGDKGPTGPPGGAGAAGEAGADGAPGRDGRGGDDGRDGIAGRDGLPGPRGEPGGPGPEGSLGPPGDGTGCRPANPLPLQRLTLEAARGAFRWWDLRRHLRFMEALEPGYTLRVTAEAAPQAGIDAGQVCPSDLYELGAVLFRHEYSFADGLGNGFPVEGRVSPFRRVQVGRFGGPETTTCGSCHWRGGPAGGGSLQDNSFLLGDGDRISTADERNPPALPGVGVAQVLAEQFTSDLQSIRDDLMASAIASGLPVEGPLIVQGVDFGLLTARPDGSVDTSEVAGVDADLVVKPFGWKGTFRTLREFASGSLHLHFGIQSEHLVEHHRAHPDPELVGAGSNPEDPDDDGATSELTEGQLTALVTYLAMLELPVARPFEVLHEHEPVADGFKAPRGLVFLDEWTRGRQLFHEVGCATCHVPRLILRDPTFRTTSLVTGGTLEIDLSREGEEPRLAYDDEAEGYPVWSFSDFRRHDLGQPNASQHLDEGVAETVYLTRRLWGLNQSPPYMYDGHAPWFDHAILAHAGEASDAREQFRELPAQGKMDLRVYLLSLRRERRVVVP